MAKKTRSTESLNKAQLIRDAFEKHGLDASAKDVQLYTESHGASVAAAQISNIRTKLKGSSGAKSGGKKRTVTAGELIQAREMAEKVGGVIRAKELLDILSRLS